MLSRWERILDMVGLLLYCLLEEKHPSVQILVCASDGPFGPNTLGTATTRERIQNTRS